MSRPQVIMDIECFSNYFLVAFLRMSDDAIVTFDFSGDNTFDKDAIRAIIDKYELITFNGISYDIPMLRLALQGANTAQLKFANDDIIIGEIKPYQFEKKHSLEEMEFNHIDLIEVAPGKASLKIYAGRMHCKKMQDLPYEPNKVLTVDEMLLVKTYCGNDLLNTKQLLINLTPQIELRRKMSNQYKCDLRSKSDAQIAETVIKAEIQRKTKGNLGRSQHVSRFVYEAPAFIKFSSEQLCKALEIVTTRPFEVSSSGRIEMPRELATLQIKIGHSLYNMGMGGLHSTEKMQHHIADNKTLLCDWDYDSFYPNIILDSGLFPQQLGEAFLSVYREIVEERLEEKSKSAELRKRITLLEKEAIHAKSLSEIREEIRVCKEQLKLSETACDALKLTINSSFGKFGSPYSALYAPELMIQVTITGQLMLLMLIEELENNGIPVVSANTDGIVIRCPVAKEQTMIDIIARRHKLTRFNMARTDYSGIYSRDVNNYIAVKLDGKVKTKGCFKSGGLQKNPQNEICNMAVIKHLTEGAELEDTIRACEDVTKFLTVRTVKGGAVKGGVYLGKAIRWLYRKGERGTINYKSNNNTVPRTFGAYPVMDILEVFPTDIDYDWYLKEAYELLADVGIGGKNGMMSLF